MSSSVEKVLENGNFLFSFSINKYSLSIFIFIQNDIDYDNSLTIKSV
jgi:hypothetical protein